MFKVHPGHGTFGTRLVEGDLIDLSDVSVSDIIYSNSKIVVIKNLSDCQFSLLDCLHEMLFYTMLFLWKMKIQKI